MGTLKYLNLNTTFNSSIQMNYRQTESAFWTWYMPTLVGVVTPTYPPFTEYWWEPRTPIQVRISLLCTFSKRGSYRPEIEERKIG
jgi:hypothetical protein